jgi:hypothetical protein
MGYVATSRRSGGPCRPVVTAGPAHDGTHHDRESRVAASGAPGELLHPGRVLLLARGADQDLLPLDHPTRPRRRAADGIGLDPTTPVTRHGEETTRVRGVRGCRGETRRWCGPTPTVPPPSSSCRDQARATGRSSGAGDQLTSAVGPSSSFSSANNPLRVSTANWLSSRSTVVRGPRPRCRNT